MALLSGSGKPCQSLLGYVFGLRTLAGAHKVNVDRFKLSLLAQETAWLDMLVLVDLDSLADRT